MAKYLHIAVYLVCFYDAIVLLLLPSSASCSLAGDGSSAGMIAVMIALIIGLGTLYLSGFKKLPDLWIGLFLLFMVFSSFHSPNIVFDSAITPKDSGLFNYKPMFEAFIYLLMFMGIYSMDLDLKLTNTIELSLCYTGIIYAGYILFQFIGMDQLYQLVHQPINELSRNPHNGGFIGQPVFSAALLTICLPFVFKHKIMTWGWLVIMAILATGNRSALIAVFISGLYFLTNRYTFTIGTIMVYIGILAIAMALFMVHIHIFDSSGRFITWKEVIKDMIHPSFFGLSHSFVLTGFGIGAFSVLFPFYHQSAFFSAHNEYLEVIYGLSFIGLFLFLKMQYNLFSRINDQHIVAALLGISLIAITNPVWHVAQIQFLTVLLAGLAYNKGVNYGV